MSIAYLDTSALVKLVVAEAESSALRAWLGALPQAAVLATSTLTRVELRRAALRHSAPAVDVAERVLASTAQIAMTPTVVDAAARLEPASLRSLDAIHIACAQQAGAAVTSFVAYDARLAAAAATHGFTVLAPE